MGQYKLFLRFARMILPYRAVWFFALLLSAAVSLLGLVNPYLTKLFIDKAMGDRDMKLFIVLAAAAAAVFIAASVFEKLRQYLERYVKTRVRISLNKDIFEKITDLPFRWFHDKSTGGHVYKINYDIGRTEDLITTVPPQAIALFPKMALILVIIFSLDWKMALLASCLAPALYIPAYYFNKKRRIIWESQIKKSENIFKVLCEFFSHILPIKIFGREKKEAARYIQGLDDNIKIELENSRMEIMNSFAAGLLNKAIIGAITLYGGYQVIKGRMTLGSLTAIMVYVSQLVVMQSSFIMFFQTIVLGLVSCQRLADILDEENQSADVTKGGGAILKKGNIVFREIGFGYLPDRPILEGLSFVIEENRHVCLVGASGSGKTTILNLILRLYDPGRGEISIGGRGIRDIRINDLKAKIGMVLQEPFLFNDSIKNNIAFGREDASEMEIVEAARISLAHDFIENMPDKYLWAPGEGACMLSEGQKQKIAIARALIKRPDILILDEAMSSMDSASEGRILSNIKENFRQMTLITVSHRLSTVMSADLVYFLKGPREMVTGRCGELLEKNRGFRDLFRAQLTESAAVS